MTFEKLNVQTEKRQQIESHKQMEAYIAIEYQREKRLLITFLATTGTATQLFCCN